MTTAPKYRQAERQLRLMIEQARAESGDRLPPEEELSRRLGVSYMTVRRAVGSLVDEGLVRRIVGKGIFVAQPSATLKPPSQPMVLVLPRLWERLDPFYFPDIVQAFQRRMSEAGHEPLVLDMPSNGSSSRIPPKSLLACMLIDRVDVEHLEHLKDDGHDVIAINRYTGRREIPSIRVDNEGGAYSATRHLILQGHRNIGFLRGNPRNLDAEERLRGYRRALRERGLPRMEAGQGFAEQHGHRAAAELLASAERPTALVAASDLAAIGAMRAAREQGLEVPGDVSVIGFGDFSVRSYVTPVLTTVRQPREALGECVAEALIQLSRGEPVTSLTLPTEFVVGGTDAARSQHN